MEVARLTEHLIGLFELLAHAFGPVTTLPLSLTSDVGICTVYVYFPIAGPPVVGHLHLLQVLSDVRYCVLHSGPTHSSPSASSSVPVAAYFSGIPDQKLQPCGLW